MDKTDIIELKDWHSNKNKDSIWTVVGQEKIYRKGNFEMKFFSISVLAETNSPQRLIAETTWLTNSDFGNTKIEKDDDGKLYYDQNVKKKFDGILLEPFVMYRVWDRIKDDKEFEVIQDFVLFHNLFFDKNGNALDETGDKIIVEINHEVNNKEIKIDTEYLRNYLAFKNKVLIRQHEHVAHSIKKLDKLRDEDTECLSNDDKSNFELRLPDCSVIDFNPSSCLRGKDIVLPSSTQKYFLDDLPDTISSS